MIHGKEIEKLLRQYYLLDRTLIFKNKKKKGVIIKALNKDGDRVMKLNTETGEYKIYGTIGSGTDDISKTRLPKRYEGC